MTVLVNINITLEGWLSAETYHGPSCPCKVRKTFTLIKNKNKNPISCYQNEVVNMTRDSFCYIAKILFTIFDLSTSCTIWGSLNNSDAFIYSWLVDQVLQKVSIYFILWHVALIMYYLSHKLLFKESNKNMQGDKSSE